MACNLTAGIPLECRDNVGGIETVYITDYSNIASITKNTGDTITQISGTGEYYEFQLIRTSSSYTETVNPSLPNGTVFYTQDVVTYFAKPTQAKRNILRTLAQSPALSVVVYTNNGEYIYLGETYGMTVSAGSTVSGKALGDASGLNITFQAFEPNPANALAGTLASVVSGITVEAF
jgi:hypothetical protein